MNCLIIEDEANSRLYLRDVLENYIPDELNIYEADSIKAGFFQINKINPDVLFLDVDLPDGSGLDIINMLNQNTRCEIIITTAYKEYAIQALNQGVSAYLLKPISITDIVNIFNKVKDKIKAKKLMSSHDKSYGNILIHDHAAINVINQADITYCRNNGNYVDIVVNSSKTYVYSKNIGEIELLLDPKNFFRIHQSYIVNKNSILKYLKGDGGLVQLKDNTELPVAKRSKKPFLEWLES